MSLAKMPRAENLKRNDYLLFSESNSRFIVEITPEKQHDFELAMGSVNLNLVGEVTAADQLIVEGLDGSTVVEQPVTVLKEAWQRPLKW